MTRAPKEIEACCGATVGTHTRKCKHARKALVESTSPAPEHEEEQAIQTTIYLKPELRKRIRKYLYEEDETSRNGLIVEALEDWLKERGY